MISLCKFFGNLRFRTVSNTIICPGCISAIEGADTTTYRTSVLSMNRTMIKKSMGLAVAMVALIGLAVGIAVAQPRHKGPREHDPKKTEVYKGLFESLKTWGQSAVLPQVLQWKSDLDGALSSDDLRTLNDLRSRAALLRKEQAALAQQIAAARKNGNDDAAKAAREKMKEMRGKHKELAEAVKPLAEKYSPTLATIGDEAKAKMKAWKEEAQGIALKWFEQNKSGFTQEQIERMGGDMKRFSHFGGGKMMKRGIVVRFMLWDGNDAIGQMEGLMAPGEGEPGLR